MQNANSFGVSFVHRRNKKPIDGKYPVFAKISVNGTKTEMTTRVYLLPSSWNKKKSAPKTNTAELKEENTYLEKLRAKLTGIFRELELNDEILHAETVKTCYLNLDSPTKSLTLLWLIAEHNSKMKGTLKPGTLKNYVSTEKYLQSFLKKGFKGDIMLRHIKYELIEDLKVFILDNPIKQHDNCNNNGVMKHLERVKKLLKWAVKNKWLKTSPFQPFELKFDPSDIQFLSLEKLESLELRHFLKPKLQLLRDLFIFSCYTGLAYCDMIELSENDIRKDSQGRYWLYTRRDKSTVKADIPLLPIPAGIIKKYKDDPRSIQRGKLFPYVSNQEMNRMLKVIAELLQLPFELNFHVARHTFATLLIQFNVHVTTVQKVMGHKKIATTMVYVHLLNLKVVEDMEVFWNAFQKSKKKRANVKASPFAYDRINYVAA